MKIAISQVGAGKDVTANLETIDRFAAEAASSGARLAVFPEGAMFECLSTADELSTAAQPLDGPFVSGLQDSATRHGITLVVGLFEFRQPGQRPYNTVVAVNDRGVVAAHRKALLYDAFGYCESDSVQPAEPTSDVFDVDGVRFGLITCWGAGDTVTVVALSEYTGIYAELGGEIRQAIELLKDEYNGKVGDFTLEFTVGETQAKTDEAIRQVKASIAKGQMLFMGTQLSNIALAISGAVNRGGGVFCTLAGAPEVTGEQCKSSTFRWSDSTWTAGREVVRAVMKDKPDLKKWFCITPDYVFGKALLESTTDAVEAGGGELGLIDLGPISYPAYRLFIMVVAVLVGIALWYLIGRTDFGSSLRAGAEDRDMAACLGINTSRLFAVTFALGVGLAALGGVLAGPTRGFSPASSNEVLGIAFVIIVVGGMGSFLGAFVGAMLIGVTQSLTIIAFPAYGNVVIYLLMIVVLLVKSDGLFGKVTRVR